MANRDKALDRVIRGNATRLLDLKNFAGCCDGSALRNAFAAAITFSPERMWQRF